MANAAYYETSLVSQEVQQREHVFSLYMYQRVEAISNSNQKVIVNSSLPFLFGCAAVIDWTVYDDILPKGTLVARARGLQLAAGQTEQVWFASFNLVFSDPRFKGSVLKIDGNTETNAVTGGEWAVVGGTGEFSGAQGSASYTYTVPPTNTETTRKLRIRFVCPAFKKQAPPVKVLPPVGGDGGQAVDVVAIPQRLLSVTIRSGDVVDSISFSYIDQDGNTQTAGPWGGKGGLPVTIQLKPTEIVKKIIGKTGDFGGHLVVTSISIQTNLDTYGPYGKGNGTQFVIPENDTGSVVGFHGRTGLFVDAIGIYTNASMVVAEN